MLEPTINISRHFDLYGIFWLAEGTQHLNAGQFTNINFPLQAPIGHVDSWLWFIVFWLNHDIIPIPILISLFLTVSIGLNIWCARWCALVWGVSPIPSWCVGLLFGLSGSMLNSLLEGSWYLTSQFWLPLIAVTLLKFQQTKKRKWYVWMIVSWNGALLTSAYLGLAASVMLLFLTLYIQPYRNRQRWFLEILGPMLIIGTVFTLLFLSLYNRREFDNLGFIDGWSTMGSTTIWNYLFWNTDLDTNDFSGICIAKLG